jgi:hypothetical protein
MGTDAGDNQTLGCRGFRDPACGRRTNLMADAMTEKSETSKPEQIDASPRPPLPEAAKRALAEAEERRRLREAAQKTPGAAEIGGREGPDPVRYGDWEKDGIISDF